MPKNPFSIGDIIKAKSGWMTFRVKAVTPTKIFFTPYPIYPNPEFSKYVFQEPYQNFQAVTHKRHDPSNIVS